MAKKRAADARMEAAGISKPADADADAGEAGQKKGSMIRTRKEKKNKKADKDQVDDVKENDDEDDEVNENDETKDDDDAIDASKVTES